MNDVRFILTSSPSSVDSSSAKGSSAQNAHKLGATFIVKTPSTDHTGVSHLAEHMCFRGSSAYPADHELFVANSLLPLSINATTYADLTYFYATSSSETLLVEAVEYLYHGLLCHHYSTPQFEAERSGVIFNELSMLEANHAYQQQVAIRLSDRSKQAYSHAGGFSHTINNVSFEALQQYKQRWYAKDNMSLIVTAPHHSVFEQCQRAVAHINDQHNQVKRPSQPHIKTQKPTLATDKTQETQRQSPRVSEDEASRQPCLPDSTATDVITWWLPVQYLSGLLAIETELAQAIGSDVSLLIDDEINTNGNIALRLLINHPADREIDKIKNTFVNAVLTYHIDPKVPRFSDGKLPTLIQEAIEHYHSTEDTKALTVAPLRHYCAIAHHSTLAPGCMTIHAAAAPSFTQPNAMMPSQFASRHTPSLTLREVPALPALLHVAAHKASAQHPFQSHQRHWVYRIEVRNEAAFISLVCSAAFWLPRTNGECYAMGIARHHNTLYLYGAQDVNLYHREAWCKQILTDSNTL